jgi:hypothetical protein
MPVRKFYLLPALLAVFTALISVAAALAQQPQHLFFRVTLGPQFTAPVSGRMLIFLEQGTGAKEVDVSLFKPTAVYVAAKEVSHLAPGSAIDIDTDDIAFPSGFSSLKLGDYQAQAVLDTGHTYDYGGREPGDLISDVIPLRNWVPGQGAAVPGTAITEPALTLNATVPQAAPRIFTDAQQSAARLEDFASPVLTKFFGQPTQVRAWVILPPDYSRHANARYPTIYWTHGFGGNLLRSKYTGEMLYQRMADGKMPPMIWVMLDESWTTGTHEFADSVNNGPWGEALTREFIPYLESRYRMDAKVTGRFLQGHSSGGWATLQLQVNYPKIFGGTWSTSPDPSDFHDFSGVDLYAPRANLYHRPDGTPYPLVRDHDRVLGTVEQFAKIERVLGEYGGQLGSFNWVFSPRGYNGRPLPMFNWDTGDIDPFVVAYWRDHYDLARIVAADWHARGPWLRGKIHLFVGTADTFYLDGAAHKFDAVLAGLHADAHFTFQPNRTHFDLYQVGADHSALFDQIAKEMYSVARPAKPRAHEQKQSAAHK